MAAVKISVAQSSSNDIFIKILVRETFKKLLFNLLAFLFLESKIIELTKYVQ